MTFRLAWHEFYREIKRQLSPLHVSVKSMSIFLVVLSLVSLSLLARKKRPSPPVSQPVAQTSVTRTTTATKNLPELERQAVADPKNKAGLTRLAVAYYNAANYDKAIATYDSIIKLDSTNAFAYNGEGNAYRDLADTNDNPTIQNDDVKKAEGQYRQ